MLDREKVIDALTACARGNITCKQSGCPYWGEYDDCIGKMARDALKLLKEQESLKQKMWNTLYAEEDRLENHYLGTDEIDKWIVYYRPFLQRGFEIAIEVIAAYEEGR